MIDFIEIIVIMILLTPPMMILILSITAIVFGVYTRLTNKYDIDGNIIDKDSQ